MTFTLTVPGTDIPLVEAEGRLMADGVAFGRASDGVWSLVRHERLPVLDRFAAQYSAVRQAEQRALTPQQIRSLPEIDADHPLAAMWEQRAESYERFRRLTAHRRPGSVLDIGAGCGWLAAHLTRAGWNAAAVDVTVDGGDGLGDARHHRVDMLLARAEMEALPFASSSVDLAVFNAALHYAGDPATALAEAARVVRPGGTVAVLDSPVFCDASAGEAMVAEFAEHVRRTHDVEPATHEGRGFLVRADFEGLAFERVDAVGGVRARLHRWRGAHRAGRETAVRPLFIATIGEAA